MEPLAAQVIKKFAHEGWTLATAESCSGGSLSDALTDIDGSSQVFLGGIIAYSPEAKEHLAGISEDFILSNGTISAETTTMLASQVKQIMNATVAIAITGVAGKTTEDKPKGLVYIAIAHSAGIFVKQYFFPGTRRAIKKQAVETALKMCLDLLS
ncbi:MAG TPA: CinA family protein [Candidatus Lokiarchaeia archaeon]|nr:CinA family protein [Candidatus Lokiarchaeia archaeon]